MSCGCNKKKGKCSGEGCKTKDLNIMSENPISEDKKNTPNWVTSNVHADVFQNREIETANPIIDGMKMAKSFISAIASKGLNNEKVTIPLKQLRVLSCFGNTYLNGKLPPCEYLRKSATPGKFFCGGCGCGDKKLTWLAGDGEEYSKLDYPKLGCPLQMPGFTNYKESLPEESISPITRRAYIEKLNYEHLKSIDVSMPHQSP